MSSYRSRAVRIATSSPTAAGSASAAGAQGLAARSARGPARACQVADAGVEQQPLGRVLEQVVVHVRPGGALKGLDGFLVVALLCRDGGDLRRAAGAWAAGPATAPHSPGQAHSAPSSGTWTPLRSAPRRRRGPQPGTGAGNQAQGHARPLRLGRSKAGAAPVCRTPSTPPWRPTSPWSLRLPARRAASELGVRSGPQGTLEPGAL